MQSSFQVVPPVPVYMKFYFFAVDNPDEVSAGERPNVTEVGPYVYRETRRKEDLLTVDNDKLYYSTYMEYHFDQVKHNKDNRKLNKEFELILH